MLFKKEYEIKYYEKNVLGDLKESALLNFLQDAATLSAESLGFGPTFVFQNNYAWVVLKYHIELYKRINNCDSVTLTTEPRGISRLYAFRDFGIYSQSGDLIGKVISTWALIDMNTRKILPVQKVLPMMFPYEKRENELEYIKFSDIETPKYSKEYIVRFDDVDVNRHANNSNYIVWALDSLPVEFRMNHFVKTIDLKFKKEAYADTKIKVVSDINQNISCHKILGYSDNEELANIYVQWQQC